MEAHFICIDKNGCRWYLGKNTETGEATWISEWIVKKPMTDIYPIIWKTREYAEESAKKIGGGVYVLTVTVKKSES